ncbi:MAG: hypothetical protein DI601_01365 [Azospirillum brasilense]|nr:MAG: hypothetical protein DI601_01365 [Azospirillum brasilense]
MRRILTGGLLAMMLLALALAGFRDFLGPAAPPSPGSWPDQEPALAGGPPLLALPPADVPLPDSLPALEREAVQLREGLAQINQAMDRMLDGVLSVLRPYGEARMADDAASRRLEMLSALRSQSLDRLSRIEMRRAEITAGGEVPPTAAAVPPEPPALPLDGTRPFRTAGLPLPGLSTMEDAAGGPAAMAPVGSLNGETRGETGIGETASLPAPPPATREGRESAGVSGGMPAPDEPVPVPAVPLLRPAPPAREGVAAKSPPRALRAEPASLRSAAANPARCRSIILRGQLGEGLSFADRSFLRGHCPG